MNFVNLYLGNKQKMVFEVKHDKFYKNYIHRNVGFITCSNHETLSPLELQSALASYQIL